MATAETADFLVEIGTEELPPRALKDLMRAFAANLETAFERERLRHGDCSAYASPRRLAVLVSELALRQEDRESDLKGPPTSVAFDAEGRPTAAARAFAARCSIAVEELGRTKTPKGEWLSCRAVEKGRRAAELLPALVQESLERLPVPRRMRWGSSDIEFVRPVHWLLMLHGADVVDGNVLGLRAGNVTRGHRFLASREIVVETPGHYAELLENEGFVLADFAARRERIRAGVAEEASAAGGVPLGNEALYDEVTALTEWPVPMAGRFDAGFLELPREVIVATLTHHQRYFPIADKVGKLLPAFVTVANIVSEEPAKVRDGNERVIRPRLADAAFFWHHDRKTPLADRMASLKDVVYNQGLGSLYDKSVRVARLAVDIASRLDLDAAALERAAMLSRCDLSTGMVGEFPELQGLMGRYYAGASGESDTVAEAIGEMYLPRFAGDTLPSSGMGRALSLADKIDSLAGHFALGRKPSGNRDPFGLRRGSLGIVRILVEAEVELDLQALLAASLEHQPTAEVYSALSDELYDFIVDRMRSWHLERNGATAEIFEAVRVRRPASLLDFERRLQAVAAFVDLEQAESLAAANKRIANILRQSGKEEHGAIDSALLVEDAEKELSRVLYELKSSVQPLLRERAYTVALGKLAELRDPVDRFFDEVMVMSDDEATRRNRLAMLAELRLLFLGVADVSRLSIG